MAQHFLSENEIQDLIKRKAENDSVDFKRGFAWGKNKEETVKIVKDILGFANIEDGGYLIIGVEDDGSVSGVSPEQKKSFDTTTVNDFVHKYTDPKHSVTISHYTLQKDVVVIRIPEFSEEPIICKKEAQNSANKPLLRRGSVYIRTGRASTEEMPSSQEMRELLGRAVRKKGDQLLNDFARILEGRPATVQEEVDKFTPELTEALGFIDTSLDISTLNGYWEITITPLEYAELTTDQTYLKESLKKAEVDLRGWNFPHFDKDDFNNFSKGVQSWTKYLPSHIEAFRLYKSGLFIMKRALWEDGDGLKATSGKDALSFAGAIYSVTEFFLFAKRLYAEVLKLESGVRISIKLHGAKDRELVPHGMVHLWEGYVSGESTIQLERTLSLAGLNSYWQETAADMCIELFRIFNWDRVTLATIEEWQQKMLSRQ